MAAHTAADYEALGLYDPAQPDAAKKLELLDYLVGLGATPADLIAYRDELPGLATVLVVRGGPALTVADAAERAGIQRDKLLRVMRAAGFPAPRAEDRAVSEQLAELVSGMEAAEAVFGEDAVLQFIRVMGSAAARLANAMVSMFLVNVEHRARDADTVGLALARANAEASALLPTVNTGIDILLRQHVIAARRTTVDDPAEAGFESQPMCVGFVDLVGSTALAQRLSIGELGALLTAFEHIVADSVTAHRGRVVKLIGDAVLYTADDERSVCQIALELTDALRDHPDLPPVRAGVAGGPVLLRDGDVFGPVVNLAARAVKAGAASEVVAPGSLARAAGLAAEPLGTHQLKGIDDEVELFRVRAPIER